MLIALGAIICLIMLVGGAMTVLAEGMADTPVSTRTVSIALLIAVLGLVGLIVFLITGLRDLAVWVFG